MVDISQYVAQFGKRGTGNAGAGIGYGIQMLNRQDRNRMAEQGRQDQRQQRNQMAIAQEQQAQRDYMTRGVEVLQSLPPEQRPQAWEGLIRGAADQGWDVTGEGAWDERMLPQLQGAFGVKAARGDQPSIGTYNPRDYTVDSFAEFRRTGNPDVLERYAEFTQGGVRYGGGREAAPLLSEAQALTDADLQAEIARRQARASRIGQGEGAAAAAGDEADAAARIAQAREQAKLQAQKIISEQGQMSKLQDAETAYNALKNADLDVIYGKGERWVPEYLRSQKGIDMIARRDQLVGMLKLGARGELKGQGPITEGEQGILGQAITVLENPNISPDLASQALDEAMTVLRRNAGQSQLQPAAQSAQPPVQGARQAPDGNWYIQQNGQFFKVEP